MTVLDVSLFFFLLLYVFFCENSKEHHSDKSRLAITIVANQLKIFSENVAIRSLVPRSEREFNNESAQ